MKRSAQLTLQIHGADGWHDAALVEIADDSAGIASPATLAYDTNYYFTYGNADFHAGHPAVDHRALSVRQPLDLDAKRLPTWPPFLLDLLPQGAARKRIAAELGLAPDSKALELKLLLRAGGAPIGNLRVKEAWIAEQARLQGSVIHGVSEQEILERGDAFRDMMDQHSLIASGSSGVQGEWPKILLTRSKDGLYYPDSVVADEEAEEHIIVKMSRAEFAQDRLILQSEACYQNVARRLGLRVGPPPSYYQDTLILRRFDRESRSGSAVVDRESRSGSAVVDREVAAGKVTRFGQESLVSALGIAEFGHITTHERYIETLHRCCTDPKAEIVEYVLRDVLNQAMGDTDNHGRNTALQKRPDGWIGLTPRFDFAPMVFAPGIIAPSTSWACLRGQPLNSGYQPVCDAIARITGAPEIAAAVRDALVTRAELVRQIPEMASQYGVPAEVIARACRRAGETAGKLAALAGGR